MIGIVSWISTRSISDTCSGSKTCSSNRLFWDKLYNSKSNVRQPCAAFNTVFFTLSFISTRQKPKTYDYIYIFASETKFTAVQKNNSIIRYLLDASPCQVTLIHLLE